MLQSIEGFSTRPGFLLSKSTCQQREIGKTSSTTLNCTRLEHMRGWINTETCRRKKKLSEISEYEGLATRCIEIIQRLMREVSRACGGLLNGSQNEKPGDEEPETPNDNDDKDDIPRL